MKFVLLSREEKNKVPVIEINPKEYDFGTMHEGEQMTTSFCVQNKGTKALIIRKIEASCGCTVPVLNERVIQPNQSTTIKVAFRARGKEGKQHKTLTLFCNDPSQSVVTFHVKCFIKK